ncbi:excinuclease ABC subunit UvrA [Candidatus Odyssella thessalonicensis]|uniref:excinuclease ABC subunit UvrA n=1 Tax=Candidatus Odyssella thessalonicensis TaxID=84647 RepID=UPI000225AF21|nr:excinuclease ABC subunit UvrA [Candidatus Odyssella thessalonicensis]
MTSIISIRGAREHNLKNINVDIPRDKLVVITGLSGSGKSSLAFDTLYAEGQRRYVESLSAYARQFLQLMQKPDVDSIEGLSPAISIEQKTTSKNPRSTVGTVTELYDYLRLLFARIGIPYSPATGLAIEAQTVTQMVDRILNLPEKTRLMLLAPIVRGRKGEYKKEILELRKKGFQRIRIDGTVYDIEDTPDLNKKVKHDIDVVVDRIVVNPDVATRLADSLETALNLSDGLVYVENVDTQDSFTLSSKFACPVSGFTLDEIEPRLFSFNSPHGACPTCDGLGVQINFDPRLVVPNPHLSLRQGAIAPWSTSDNTSKRAAYVYEWYMQTLAAVAEHFGGDMDTPFADLSEALQKALLHGSGRQEIPMLYDDGVRRFKASKPFEGVIPNLERRWKETESDWMREELSKYQTAIACHSCQGYRLKPEALSVKIAGKSIGQVTELSIQDAAEWFKGLELTQKQQDIAHRILKEINSRLQFLVNVGLDYLTLSRSSGTLSGGESQRIRLASQIGSGLTGVLYVLDEPSIGLHQRDNDKLLDTLRHLRDIGNTVVVVEHDEDAIRLADHVIDMGPRAGAHGGQIIAQGTPQDIMANGESITGAYLKHEKKIPVPTSRRPGHENKKLVLKGATVNNLKNVSIEIPLGTFTCITGVSGGGKSSLTIETLYKALANKLNGSRDSAGNYTELQGIEHLDKVIDIDQSPIGRTPRSNPATYIGCFTPIREWFAGLPESKARGYSPGRFSFNVKGGRCEACQGDGVIKIEMHFLPDVYVQCDQCHGKRYNRETLEVTFKGKSIADVLDMTVEEATAFFEAHPAVRNKLETLQRVGLGYVHVGQQATTLSGGEAQRVKLAKELSRRATGKTIYILDEPTTGLHFEDIAKLLEVLHTLVDQGNTVIVIEHNLEVIKTADYIIDMGPEGGHKGGKVVACGTPEDIINVPNSYTGHYLKAYL